MTKQQVLNSCFEIVNNKIEQLNSLHSELKKSIENETKSSAGDKHETARAMVQLEQEKLGKQSNEFLLMHDQLSKINPELISQKICFGSLVETNIGWFFISVGLGKTFINDTTVFAINQTAPLGKMLIGKTIGEVFPFNNQNIEIISVQ